MRDESSSRGSGEDDLFMMRNMSLGMGLGEIDGALVRVRDDGRATAHSPSRSRAAAVADVRRRRRMMRLRIRLMWLVGSAPNDPNVEVLAVFECKRNPDDARRGFLRRRADLGWLAGESPRGASDSYGDDDGSAREGTTRERYVNRNHPTGHFVFGYHLVRRMERVFFLLSPDRTRLRRHRRRR